MTGTNTFGCWVRQDMGVRCPQYPNFLCTNPCEFPLLFSTEEIGINKILCLIHWSNKIINFFLFLIKNDTVYKSSNNSVKKKL